MGRVLIKLQILLFLKKFGKSDTGFASSLGRNVLEVSSGRLFRKDVSSLFTIVPGQPTSLTLRLPTPADA